MRVCASRLLSSFGKNWFSTVWDLSGTISLFFYQKVFFLTLVFIFFVFLFISALMLALSQPSSDWLSGSARLPVKGYFSCSFCCTLFSNESTSVCCDIVELGLQWSLMPCGHGLDKTVGVADLMSLNFYLSRATFTSGIL